MTSSSAHDIVALRWLARDADAATFLTTRRQPCETATADPALAHRRMLGRIAFESPALLGGAAGRMGLSCSSCHVSGRDNPDLFIAGVSGAPGTADVTSSLFSKVRGDGAFNPVPIPDLAARDGTQIRDRASPAFRDKVHGLIVEEFDGETPPPDVFDAVLAYLDGLDVAACADLSARLAHTFADDLSAAKEAARVAETGATSPAVALFYLRAARERLQRIDERYPAADAHSQLVDLSLRLAERAEALRRGRKAASIDPAAWSALDEALSASAAASLYNPEALQAALKN